MISFKQPDYVFEEVLEPTKQYVVSYEFEGDPSTVVHIEPGCGCTAQAKVEGNHITAVYTENVAASIDMSTARKHYPSGTVEFSKYMNVFVEDEEDLFIHDGMDKKTNPNKSKVKLTFKGKVKIF